MEKPKITLSQLKDFKDELNRIIYAYKTGGGVDSKEDQEKILQMNFGEIVNSVHGAIEIVISAQNICPDMFDTGDVLGLTYGEILNRINIRKEIIKKGEN